MHWFKIERWDITVYTFVKKLKEIDAILIVVWQFRYWYRRTNMENTLFFLRILILRPRLDVLIFPCRFKAEIFLWMLLDNENTTWTIMMLIQRQVICRFLYDFQPTKLYSFHNLSLRVNSRKMSQTSALIFLLSISLKKRKSVLR